LLVDPRQAGDIASAMARLEGDENLRARLKAQGLARARLYSWENAAKAARLAYAAALNLPKRGQAGR
jgi:glycosyltransferase involved in cell wall biosynthesis